jgi:hypothetical protein
MAVVAAFCALMLAPGAAEANPAVRSWSAPFALSRAGANAHEPKIAVDAAGDATAVWVQGELVRSAYRPAGRLWEPASTISAGGPEPSGVAIAVNAAGDTAVVWQQQGVVVAVQRPAGGSWGVPAVISGEAHYLQAPQVALDAAGDATAVWQLLAANEEVVQGTARPAGGEWAGAVDLSPLGEEAGEPSLVVDPAGDATVVWAAGAIQSVSKPAGGPWEPAVDVAAPGPIQERPRAAVDGAGDVTVVWESDGVVQSAAKPAAGSWQVPESLSEPGAPAEDASVSVDRQGDATAVWEASLGTGFGVGSRVVQSASRAAGGPWQAPVSVSEPADSETRPQIALDAAGDATSVWTLPKAAAFYGGFTVQSSSRVAGEPWAAPVNLSAKSVYEEGPAGAPQVGTDPAGDTTAVWELYEGHHFIVQASQYLASPCSAVEGHGRYGKRGEAGQLRVSEMLSTDLAEPQKLIISSLSGAVRFRLLGRLEQATCSGAPGQLAFYGEGPAAKGAQKGYTLVFSISEQAGGVFVSSKLMKEGAEVEASGGPLRTTDEKIS